MSISFDCGICGRRLKAKDEHAGKRTKCPGCATILEIPAAIVEPPPPVDEWNDSSPYSLEEPPAPAFPPARTPRPSPSTLQNDNDSIFHQWNQPSKTTMRFGELKRDDDFVPLKSADLIDTGPTPLREYAYCLLIFTLIPLMISLLGSDDEKDLENRIEQTIEAATPDQRARLIPMLNDEKVEKDQFLDALPDHKIVGAHLPHDTQVHWLYALISALTFLTILALLFKKESVNVFKLLGVGVFTGTVGILLLLICQWCASLRFGRIPLGKGAIIFLILIFIGWSYASALDPDSNFLLSAFGFTFGVGLCEELCKALPIFFLFKSGTDVGWRGACVLGLASGVGFGVSEGVMYSGNMYNGITGPDAYLLRFVSCVALHAMWAGSVGMQAYRRQADLAEVDDGSSFLLVGLQVLAVPMVLHGFYDTLLKKDMNAIALVVSLLTFCYFAYLVETSRGFDADERRSRRRKSSYA